MTETGNLTTAAMLEGPPAGGSDRKSSGPLLRAVHSSGRYDRPLPTLAAALDSYAHAGGIITLTEQDGRDSARERVYDASGLSWVRMAPRGAGECAALWTARWRLSGAPIARQLTGRTYRRVTGQLAAPVHALTVPLRDDVTDQLVLVSTAHLPVRNTALRRLVWSLAVKGWVAHLDELVATRYPDAELLVRADWNRDLRQPAQRSTVNARLAPLDPQGRLVVPQGGGTHGKRVLDADWTTLPGASSTVLPDDPSSDHRPYLTTAPLPEG